MSNRANHRWRTGVAISLTAAAWIAVIQTTEQSAPQSVADQAPDEPPAAQAGPVGDLLTVVRNDHYQVRAHQGLQYANPTAHVHLTVDASGRATLQGMQDRPTLDGAEPSDAPAPTPVAFTTARVTVGGAELPLGTPEVSTGDCTDGDTRLDASGACLRTIEVGYGAGLTAWFDNPEQGVRQGWTIAQGEGDITIEVAVDGLTPSQDDDGLVLSDDHTSYRGTDLRAWDAEGHDLPLTAEISGDGFALTVDTEGATFPVHVDPTWYDNGGYKRLSQLDGQFGLNVGSAGDVNDDGYDDIAVLAPWYDDTTTDEGRLFVFHGAADGPDTVADFEYSTGVWGTRLGDEGSISVGDLNDDGYADVAIGAPNTPYSQYWTNYLLGRVYVFEGSATGLGSTPTILASTVYNNWYGQTTAIGDFDGDGYDDLAVAEPGYDINWQAANVGRVHVHEGSATSINTTANYTLAFAEVGAYGGWGLAAGHFTDDGYDDLVVGLPYRDNGHSDEGRVSIYKGSTTGLQTSRARKWEVNQSDVYFGSHVSNLGDVNGDGLDDFGVAAAYWDGGETDEGGVWIYHGGTNKPSLTADRTIEIDQADALLSSVSPAGDINGDGYDDILISAWQYDDGETDEGKVWLHLGSATGVEEDASQDWQSDQTDAGMGGSGFNDKSSAIGVGDVTGDGYDDIALGVPYWNHNATQIDVGIVYLKYGSSDGIDDDPTPPPVIGSITVPDGDEDTVITATVDAWSPVDMGITIDWDFGDGATGTGASVDHTWDDDGTYTVTVTVTDDDGQTATDTVDVVISAIGPSIDAWTAPDTDEGVLTTLSVTASGGGLTYDWDFGDGTTATGANPTHSYDDDGTYTVTVTVTDDQGTEVSDTATITVANLDPVITSMSAPDTQTNQSTALSAVATDAPGDTLAYAWDFGDGTTATGSAVNHTWTTSGTYTVTLTVTDDDGGSSSQTASVDVGGTPPSISALSLSDGDEGDSLAFSISATDPTGGTLSYAWDLGDGSTATGSSVSHTYTDDGDYTVSVVVTSSNGESNTTSGTSSIANVDPTIDAMVAPDGDQGDSLSFSASASDPGDDTLTYTWDFGDGNTATGSAPAHSYASGGTYTVTLTVTDGDGGSASQTETVDIVATDPILNSWTHPDGTEGVGIAFTADATDGAGNDATITWDFGDGTTGTGSAASHTYADDGSYTVTVTVTDDAGNAISQTSTVTVANADPLIVLGDAPSGFEGDALDFSASASDVAADTVTLLWDFGDGDLALGEAPSHAYDDDGTYTVTVTATDEDGGSSTAEFDVVIDNADPTGLLTTDTTGDEGDSLYFGVITSDPGDDTVTATWSFGDGSDDVTGHIVSHVFADDGAFTVTLTLTDEDGGEATYEVDVTVDNVAPIFQLPLTAPAVAYEGSTYEATLVATDPGDDEVTFTLVSGPDGMTLDATTGEISWDPTFEQAAEGSASVTVRASDDEGATADADWDITIYYGDSDEDGMADSWETDNGLDPDDPSDAAADADMDGRTNLDEFLGGTDPSAYEGPSVPTLISPDEGERVDTPIPELRWDASHPLDEPMTFTIELYEDDQLVGLWTDATDIPDEYWRPSQELPEDADIYWRVAASDSFTTSEWSVVSHFFVSAEQSAPSIPVPMFPIAGEILGVSPGLLQWSPSIDTDRDALSYELRLQLPDGTPLFDDGGIEAAPEATDVTYTLEQGLLDEGGLYQWAVRAADETGMMSDWSEWEDFEYKTVDAPASIAWISPEAGATVGTGPTLVVAAPAGADVVDLTVRFELSQDATFGVEATHAKDVMVTPADVEIRWSLFEDLIVLSGGEWYGRVQVVDQFDQASPWSTVDFVVTSGTDVGIEGDKDCGCQTGGSAAGLGWLAVLGLMGLRRRRED